MTTEKFIHSFIASECPNLLTQGISVSNEKRKRDERESLTSETIVIARARAAEPTEACLHPTNQLYKL